MSESVVESLAHDLATEHPEEAARVLATLTPEERAAFLDSCPLPVAAAVAQWLTAQELMRCIEHLGSSTTGALLAALPPTQAAAVLRRLAASERDRLIDLLPPERRRAVRRLLRYRPGSAGALMEPRVLTLAAGLDVASARRAVVADPTHLQSYVYVVDERERLVGVVDLRSLLGAADDASLESIMTREVHRLSARASREATLSHPGWEEVHSLPVVDEDNVLVGVLRYETFRLVGRAEESTAERGTGVALGELYWTGSRAVAVELLDLLGEETS